MGLNKTASFWTFSIYSGKLSFMRYFFLVRFLFLTVLLTFLLGAAAVSPVHAQSPTTRACTAPQSDINQDGVVNLLDYAILVTNFFKKNFDPKTDLNNDGKVNLFDFHILQLNFYADCANTSPAPSASPVVSPIPSPVVTPTPSPSTSPGQLSFTVNSDGDVYKNGQLYFPFGFYHVADIGNRYGDVMADDVEKMGQAGFNIVQLPITGPDGLNSSLKARQKAQQYDMTIIASYYKPSMTQWVAAMKNEPTIMAWNTADDFNVPYSNPKNKPADILRENNEVLSAAQSNGYTTYTYGSGGGYPYQSGQIPYLFGDYKDTNMSFFGVQSYPIGNTDGSFNNAPLEENLAYYRYTRNQVPGKAIFANTQAFAWEGERFPTASETRNMTYAALAEGMNGIIAYAYHEERGMRTRPELWDEMVKLRQEINGEFLQAVAGGTRTIRDTAALDAKTARVHATFWKTTDTDKQKMYVVILNTSSSSAINTQKQLELPGSWSNPKLTPVMSDTARYGRTMNLTGDGGKWYLEGSLDKEAVQVYSIEE